tara:strand:+ start:206 stop:802 length:597 start_codon:yes stop_codon:yes gene_type:complete
MTKNNFIGKCITEMIKDGTTVRFNKRIYDSKHSYSYYLESPKEFVISYFNGEKEDDWFWDFIHEYSHYIQFKYEERKWKKYDKYCVAFSSFIEGERKTISPEIIRKVQEVEADGNAKAYELMRKHKIKINVDRYIQNNNLYIVCHAFMAKYKHFFFPNSIKALKLIPTYPLSMKEIEELANNKELEAIYKERLDIYIK